MSSLVTIDIESFYDRNFSLSKISTEEYVRSDKFETIGVSVKFDNGSTQWYPQSEVAAYLASVDWADKFIIAQNTAFDGAILKWRYGVNPKGWLDTLGMSRALYPHAKSHSLKSQAERHGIGVKGTEVINALGKRYVDFSPIELERYAEYCCNDTELTYALFNTYMGMGFPRIELQLIDLTLRMFIDPVLRLDKAVLKSHLSEVKEVKANLLDTVRDMMLAGGDPDFTHQVFTEGTDGIKKLLMSNDKFAEVLRRFGVEPPTKISLTTGKTAYAFAKTDEDFKALEEHPSLEVQGLVAARLGNKSTLEETRTERFIGMADRGEFPVPLRYYGAHSGRWSGQDFVNLQNLPSRGANAGKIKKAIIAPPGYRVIDCDSSQIEARTLAWLAGQDDLIQAFENKEDVYKIMASRIYNVPVAEITPGQRQVGKVVILGAGYGVGHVKLQAFLKQQAKVEVSLEEAKRIIDAYRATYFRIPMLWKSAGNALKALALEQAMQIDIPGIVKVVPNKGLTLPNGLFIQYPDLKRVITKSLQGEEKQQWSYQSKGLPVYVYGGKCLAAGTEVLTERGWVRITAVLPHDRVWDGVEWVNHSGLTYQGEKATIVLNGVRMTPDHNVLTEEGWRNASSCKGLHGADFWMPDGSEICGSRTAFALGVSVQMRGDSNTSGDRYSEVRPTRRDILLRVRGGGKKGNTRDVQTPRILGMEVNARSLQTAVTSSMEKLWRARYTSVRSVGAFVRGILGRYGGHIRIGAYLGSYRQCRALYAGELPMGHVQSTGGESSRVVANRYASRAEADRASPLDPTVPMAPEPVYDIINAGPRSRFVVRGATGPFIVHNCVENFCQAVARCVVAEQMLRIAKRYKVVLTVHDAVAVVVKQEEATEAKAYIEACMSWRPKWAPGLPLACESGMGASYGDC